MFVVSVYHEVSTAICVETVSEDLYFEFTNVIEIKNSRSWFFLSVSWNKKNISTVNVKYMSFSEE